MLEQWVIEHLNPITGERLIILADPQRMIRAGAQAVDGWLGWCSAHHCADRQGRRGPGGIIAFDELAREEYGRTYCTVPFPAELPAGGGSGLGPNDVLNGGQFNLQLGLSPRLP
jgi:hypothetical protein